MTELSETSKHAICVAAIEAKKDIEWKFITLGGMLHRIKKEHLWEAGWDSWVEYQMDFGMTGGDISRLMGIYEVFVLHYQFKPKELAEAGGWTKVASLLPLVRRKTASREEVEEYLGIATKQTQVALRTTVKDLKRGSPCPHKDTYTITFEGCRDCGERWRVYAEGEDAPE